MFDDLPEDKPTPEVVRFYTRPVVDQAATLAAGCTKHQDGIYVHVSFPGDKTLEVDRPIYEADKARWPRHWNLFLANKPQEVKGTMLSAWGPLSPALVEDYRAVKVLTVEQLAGVPDAHIDKLGIGARAHRQAAQDFLEAARSRAPLMRVQKELEEMRAQHAALVAQLNATAQLQASRAPPAPVTGVETDARLAPVDTLVAQEATVSAPKRRRRAATQ